MTFERLFGNPYAEGKSFAGPIFVVGWDALRAWAHRNPDFAPAFLMRIAPVFDAIHLLKAQSARGVGSSWIF
jgi:hypothetical protein